MAMAPTTLAASPSLPCCSLQLHLVRRPALLLSPPHLRLRLRLPVRASPSPDPSPESFAGWSDGEEEDKDAAPGPFRGLLGPGLAGLFFLAGITFAAISIRTNGSANGSRAQLETQTQTAAYDTHNHTREEEDHVQHTQVLLPNVSEDATPANDEDGAKKHPLSLETNQISGEAPEHDSLESSDLVPNEKHIASDQASPPDDLIAPDGTECLGPAPPMSNSAESMATAYDSSDKLSGADPFEGTPKLQETLGSEAGSPENRYMDDMSTSDAIVLDSGHVVPITKFSDTSVEAASHLNENDTEQNHQLSNEDEISPPRLPDYIEHGSADQMLPFGSNDLPAEPGKVHQPLASDQDVGESQLENQNELVKSTEPGKAFSSAGFPAPSLLSAALQVPAGQIVVPAAVDPTQGNALAALQVLKVIEPGAQAGDLCTRREYARWLVVASNCLSRNTYSKVYPAMYVENVSELAFDDVTTEDPDFPFIQGLAEAGLISSKLSRSDTNPENFQNNHYWFYPESPLSRQDLVSWKMALDKRRLPEVDKNSLYKTSGYIDIDKIDAAAWPALAADLGAGDQSITALAFGFTRLFQPDKPVTKGQAALALSTGDSAEVVMEELARIEAEKMAEAAVNAHGALVAQVEKDINASFERELAREREKIETLEKLAEEARFELEKLRAEREEEKNALIRGRAAVESEIEVLSKLRSEVEEQLQSVLSKKVEISFEKNRIDKLQKEIENENQAAVQLQYELEVERKALSMARAWAEDEAKKAREHARALEEARNQWERQGIKVVVEGGLEDDASAGVTWANAGKEHPVDEAINRAESLLEKLKSMSADMKVRACHALQRVMQHVRSFISSLKERAAEARQGCIDFGAAAASKANKLSSEARAFGSTVGDKSKKVVEDCKEKYAHRFKTD
ncbi:uncharacterized protein LOC100825490 [Brachypodium distachyon]|uniref:SLH domain-containing protein n=1 Tax=Brachypodium distachyon TaxID=15368 RepID=A0A0Q3JHY7_BRADI|nr:uncharacterized protein LOC100825490 [Brachypodium distachyon]KQK11916.1 hypothetical protein BRADI_1g00480v3 [Brachypodium distachyon]|eukprot:XP_024313443.1 uncharacterized protein LOC100825490 [Brachypodium distachyon]